MKKGLSSLNITIILIIVIIIFFVLLSIVKKIVDMGRTGII